MRHNAEDETRPALRFCPASPKRRFVITTRAPTRGAGGPGSA